MDYEQIAVAFHLIGFALGLGGASVSDVMFLQSMRNKMITAERYKFLQTLSKILWVGFWLLTISGVVIFALIYAEQGSIPMLASPRWQTKLTLVGIIFLNGLFFKFGIFPVLKNLVGQQLSLANISPVVWKLAFSGTISILSWYSILVISQLPRTFRPPYLYFMGVYFALLIIGVVVSKTMLTHLAKRQTN